MAREGVSHWPSPTFPERARCIDVGCGFGETTQRLAELVGPEGFALGTDSSPRFVADARRDAGRGEAQLGSYSKTPQSVRRFCRTCGGHVITEHPSMELTDVYSAIIPDLPFKPAVHVHYQETVLHITDGLPKMADVPAELGGSGKTLPE